MHSSLKRQKIHARLPKPHSRSAKPQNFLISPIDLLERPCVATSIGMMFHGFFPIGSLDLLASRRRFDSQNLERVHIAGLGYVMSSQQLRIPSFDRPLAG